jgi:hypothetical protein
VTILDALKAANPREYLALIYWDQDCRAVVLGWTLYQPAPRPAQWDAECPPGWSIRRVLRHCWKGIRLDPNKLAILSGVPARSAQHKFERLMEARLVYPDGTANEEALLIIRAEMEGKVLAAQATRAAPTTVQPQTAPPGAIVVQGEVIHGEHT